MSYSEPVEKVAFVPEEDCGEEIVECLQSVGVDATYAGGRVVISASEDFGIVQKGNGYVFQVSVGDSSEEIRDVEQRLEQYGVTFDTGTASGMLTGGGLTREWFFDWSLEGGRVFDS